MGHVLSGREREDFTRLLQRHQETMAGDLDREPVSCRRLIPHGLQTLCQTLLQGPEGFFVGHL